ncbi:FAD-binding oxidoreductase [Marinimicrobium locisalis]|uniref:FAD-binding oxidoreductase n=1 Tax=Marinimicrobium locisalis TaxID=546022 RepID=UPI0032217E36
MPRLHSQVLSFVAFLLTLSLPSASEANDGPVPFTSDGCSAFPNGTLAQQTLWLECCTAHDLAYWQGGTYRERLAADRELLQCVRRAGEPGVAMMMLVGVRIGGTPYLPTRFRWGYGWPYPRGYRALSEKEKNQLDNRKP